MTEHRGGRDILRGELAHKFVEWLSFQPNENDICRSLVTEYFLEHGAHAARITRLNIDDSLTFVGEYGYETHESDYGKTLKSEVWRNRPHVATMIATGRLPGSWSPDHRLVVSDLLDRGAIQGFLTIRFVNPVDEETRILISAQMHLYTLPLSLYISFKNRIAHNGTSKTN